MILHQGKCLFLFVAFLKVGKFLQALNKDSERNECIFFFAGSSQGKNSDSFSVPSIYLVNDKHCDAYYLKTDG